MGLIALLVGIAVIIGFLAYWLIMATLFVIGVIFIFWAFLIAMISGDPYVGGVGGVFATVLTLWLWSVYNEKKSNLKSPPNV
jgi:uncharacterized metal-binding protein